MSGRHQQPATSVASGTSYNRLGVTATLHCMTGCVIGEVAGLAIATAAGWGTIANIAIAFPFAFLANRALIKRGKGHALVHRYHQH